MIAFAFRSLFIIASAGDLAALDEQGYCHIVGRVKDLIIRGGENIYPREIEEFLYSHPKVLDVAVVGVAD
jgi:fatty-acyl-CoA synthase